MDSNRTLKRYTNTGSAIQKLTQMSTNPKTDVPNTIKYSTEDLKFVDNLLTRREDIASNKVEGKWWLNYKLNTNRRPTNHFSVPNSKKFNRIGMPADEKAQKIRSDVKPTLIHQPHDEGDSYPITSRSERDLADIKSFINEQYKSKREKTVDNILTSKLNMYRQKMNTVLKKDANNIFVAKMVDKVQSFVTPEQKHKLIADIDKESSRPHEILQDEETTLSANEGRQKRKTRPVKNISRIKESANKTARARKGPAKSPKKPTNPTIKWTGSITSSYQESDKGKAPKYGTDVSKAGAGEKPLSIYFKNQIDQPRPLSLKYAGDKVFDSVLQNTNALPTKQRSKATVLKPATSIKTSNNISKPRPPTSIRDQTTTRGEGYIKPPVSAPNQSARKTSVPRSWANYYDPSEPYPKNILQQTYKNTGENLLENDTDNSQDDKSITNFKNLFLKIKQKNNEAKKQITDKIYLTNEEEALLSTRVRAASMTDKLNFLRSTLENPNVN